MTVDLQSPRQVARYRAGVLLTNALLAWSLLAFGGVYRWTAAPILVGAVVLAATVRPPVGRRDTRALDVSLVSVVAAGALQLVPLPPDLLGWLAPRAADFHSTYALQPIGGDPTGQSGPLAVAPDEAAWALALMVAAVLVFWSARALADQGASRRFIWALTWLGLVTAVVAVVARASSGGRIYWWWVPEQPGAQPYGPMVNRNHYAGWLMMALPLATGHALARSTEGPSKSHGLRPRSSSSRRDASRLDVRGMWLLAAIYLMTVALVLSTSRSALLGLTTGLVAATPLAWRRLGWRERSWLAAGLAVAALGVATWANPRAISERLDVAGPARETRLLIWRETWRIVRDFPLTGTGLGTFEAAMTVYQRPPRAVFFNHAHNEYLQLLAEGGLLLGLPALLVAVAGIRLARRRLREDDSAGRFRRLGALAALVAVAGQSLWDVPLRAPANAILAVVAAAILTHRPRRAVEERH